MKLYFSLISVNSYLHLELLVPQDSAGTLTGLGEFSKEVTCNMTLPKSLGTVISIYEIVVPL